MPVGDCERKTVAWRYSGQRLAQSPLGWLPVCLKHAEAADAKTAQSDGSNARTAENFHTSDSGDGGTMGVMSETCIEMGTSLRAEDEPCLDPERCRRMGYCLRDPSDERYPEQSDGRITDG